MLQKICPACHAFSYSSSPSGKWLCPSCQQNITKIKAVPIMNMETKKRASCFMELNKRYAK